MTTPHETPLPTLTEPHIDLDAELPPGGGPPGKTIRDLAREIAAEPDLDIYTGAARRNSTVRASSFHQRHLLHQVMGRLNAQGVLLNALLVAIHEEKRQSARELMEITRLRRRHESSELVRRAAALDSREARAATTEARQAERDREQDLRAEALQAFDQDLEEQHADLLERETALHAAQRRVEDREAALDALEQDLAGRALALTRREMTANEVDAVLRQRVAELDRQAVQLAQLKADLDEKAERIARGEFVPRPAPVHVRPPRVSDAEVVTVYRSFGARLDATAEALGISRREVNLAVVRVERAEREAAGLRRNPPQPKPAEPEPTFRGTPGERVAQALEHHRGNVARAAASLGMDVFDVITLAADAGVPGFST